MTPSAPDLPERVRQACAEVTRRAQHVHIDDERLAAYTATLIAAESSRSSAWQTTAVVDADSGCRLPHSHEDRAALVIQLDAVNFGSGWHPVLAKAPGLSGARTVAARYRQHADRHGVPTAADLVEVTSAEVSSWLGQDPNGPVAELMGLFASSLQDLGRFVLEQTGGSFERLVESAGRSAAHLASMLGALPSWRDEPTYQGDAVPLYKRAQITAADLDRAFDGDGPGRFDDLDRLTMFADNLVPHVLRIDGVLVVDATLVARIDTGDLLAYGSPEEVELRAVAVEAVERLSAATGIAPRLLDEQLWHRGGAPRSKAHPRHRCRTTAY